MMRMWISWKCEQIFQIQQTAELYYSYPISPKTPCGWDERKRGIMLPGT